MFLEQSIQLRQWLETLQEPQRLLAFICIVLGFPLLCIALLYIEKKLENKGE